MKNVFKLFFVVSLISLLATPPAVAQSVIATIDLNDGDPNGIQDNPFGITVTPEGTHALVAISGGLDDPNTPANENGRRVDVIDLDSLTVVGQLDTGFFPEEIAIRSDGSGNTERIYVANSSDSTVSVFDSITNPTAVNTIALPGFSFPFDATLSPDQDRLFVSTVGGVGDIFIIDTDPQSGTFEMIVGSFNVPGGHGRLAFDGPSRLVVPHTVFAFDFSHSDAFITILDPDNPATRSSIQLAAGGNFEYPTIQEVAVRRDGIAYVPVFGGGDDIFVIDVRTAQLVTLIDLGPLAENQQHGVALREDEGLLLVTNFVQSTLSVIDVTTNQVIADVAVGNEPNAVAFSPDGSVALVTNQNSFSVSVVSDFPLPSFELSGPAFPSLLDPVSYSFEGGEFDRPVRLLISVGGNDPNPFESTTVDLTPPIRTRFTGTLDRAGSAATPTAAVPNNANLVGRVFHLQGVTTYGNGTQVVSNPFAVIVQ